MATISSAALAPSLSLNLTRKITPLCSSSSVFFSTQNFSNRAGCGLSVTRPGKSQKRGLSCTCLFGLGVPELVVIAGVAALVFGPKKLPEVGKSIGKTVKSFQQAAKEFESELKKDGEAEDPPSEKIAPVGEEEKQEDKARSTKESS